MEKKVTYIGVPNKPVLPTGLVPIKYNEEIERWVTTSIDDADWYNYDEQKWANAVVLMDIASKTIGDPITVSSDEGTVDTYAMFVWIPRYSYKIGCTTEYTEFGVANECLGYKVDTDKTELSRVTPGAIDIKFVDTGTKEIYQDSETSGTAPTYTYLTTDTEDQRIAKREVASNWYTHPAFTFGDKELSGIWVGKFETSTDVGSNCYKRKTSKYCNNKDQTPYILPNVESLRYQTISNQFATAQKFTADGNIYGLTGDAHIMKNSEWGAVAYLAQSIYGKYGNRNYEGTNKGIYINNSYYYYTGRSGGGVGGSTPINGTYTDQTSTKTYISYGFYTYDDYLLNYDTNTKGTKVKGKGTGASTTGNIYGIYDMNGGAKEYVMGNYNDGTQQVIASSEFDPTWFTDKENEKYFDSYITLNLNTAEKDKTTNGGALSETISWYKALQPYFTLTNTWLLRGGYSSGGSSMGIFACHNGEGDAIGNSFRVSLPSVTNPLTE